MNIFGNAWKWVLANKGKVITAASVLLGGSGAATYVLSPEVQKAVSAALALVE